MEMSNGIVIIILNFVILGISGNMGVAAYGIVANLALVAVSVFTGEAQGIQPIISYNYGAGNVRNIKKPTALRSLRRCASAFCCI